ncbi:helix-turn-helix domain-containing protein [Clostridium senegalense]|uniref:helix-turn-helix domain-containing protein n=1 Tax=Clostridium senegalense TaxID=1465809 RepID=UPI00028841D8|nr:helix-turn-helix domain-containing protein [Clostridium senegalense]
MNQEEKMDTIIDRIKNRRTELMLSYQDLANKTGLSKSTLQRYETGSIKNMPLDKLEVLAKALNVEPYYLMGWDIKKNDALSKDEIALLENYNSLNSLGKNKLIEYSNDLNETLKYTEKNKENTVTELITATIPYADYEVTTFAAHDDDNPEIAKHDLEVAREFIANLKKKNK